MERKYGTVSKIRLLKLGEKPLIRFTLGTENCLIASHSLNFIADVDDGMKIFVKGYYNNRKQFVVKDYTVLEKPNIVVAFENSPFPRQKLVK
ncbi:MULTISPECIES: hypothetical protein [Enterococcus]|nr:MULTISPECIES: hypothetical protein [unclassified Enterococcus]MBO0460379.1 hypothetical protein [Enterococcus sp. DIV1298c]MBO0490783.1 hypothetical protein [Enterococcus sp. DIV1094]MBO1298799.1 hypothetical protein [Enterococcus sp. DIV1271a]